MAKPGRKSKAYFVELRRKFEEYIDTTEIPIVSEFALKVGYHRQNIYAIPQIADLLQRCVTKKEVALERGALDGKLTAAMSIFSLKQLGWKDTHAITERRGELAPTAPVEKKGGDVSDEDAQTAYFALLGKVTPP